MNTVILDFSLNAFSTRVFETLAFASNFATLIFVSALEVSTFAFASTIFFFFDHHDSLYSNLFFIHSQLDDLQTLVTKNSTRADRQFAQMTRKLKELIYIVAELKKKNEKLFMQLRNAQSSINRFSKRMMTFIEIRNKVSFKSLDFINKMLQAHREDTVTRRIRTKQVLCNISRCSNQKSFDFDNQDRRADQDLIARLT